MSNNDINENPRNIEEKNTILNGKVEYVSAGGPAYNKIFRFKIEGDPRIFSLEYALTEGIGSAMCNIVCAGGRIDYIVSNNNGDLSIVNLVKTSFKE